MSATYSMTITPNGDYKVTTQSYSYSFRCDGKDYPTTLRRTISCVRAGDSILDTVGKEDGKQTNRAHQELTPDGSAIRVTTVLIRPNGSRENSIHTFIRMNASKGFAGAWRNADSNYDRPRLLVLSLTGSHLKIDYPEMKQVTEVTLGGSEAQIQGPSVTRHVTLSAVVRSPTEIFAVQKLEGVATSNILLLLSGDGHYLVQESWRPENPRVKNRLVYERQ